MKFRKKPVIIDAEQFTGDKAQALRLGLRYSTAAMGGMAWFAPTLEGEMIVNVGAWVIRGVKGEIYPCADDIFKLTYEPVAPSKLHY